jgi:hypothetical protein
MLDDTSRAWLAAIERGDHAEEQRLEAVLDAATLLEQARRSTAPRCASRRRRWHGFRRQQGMPGVPHPTAGEEAGAVGARLQGRHPRPGQVGAWWRQWPDANIGVPTGIAFDVVDVDGPEGMARMYAKTARSSTPSPSSVSPGPAATAGSTSTCPSAAHGNKTAIYPGIDYRGAGGYVVAPPSVGADGRRYQWVRPLTLTVGAVAA